MLEVTNKHDYRKRKQTKKKKRGLEEERRVELKDKERGQGTATGHRRGNEKKTK